MCEHYDQTDQQIIQLGAKDEEVVLLQRLFEALKIHVNSLDSRDLSERIPNSDELEIYEQQVLPSVELSCSNLAEISL
jgi:hypothetical protein